MFTVNNHKQIWITDADYPARRAPIEWHVAAAIFNHPNAKIPVIIDMSVKEEPEAVYDDVLNADDLFDDVSKVRINKTLYNK